VARITSVVPFYKLTPHELGLITERQVAAYLEDVCDRRGYAAQITVDAEVVQHLISKQDPKYGARNVRASIEEVVEPALRLALMQMGDRVPKTVHVRKATETTLEVAMH
jgi:ATP-dependent Clp protease ATP-binding subunit ClpA